MTDAHASPGVERAPALAQSGRIGGLDLARALAFMGMAAAHIGDDGTSGAGDGWTWLWVSHGVPSALFAVLAGVSMGIMDSRAPSTLHTRVRVAVRAMVLIVVGAILTGLGTPVYVILASLGLMMLLALVALRWRATWLWIGGVVALVGGALVLPAVQEWAAASGAETWPVLDRLWWHHYPAIAWVGYLLLGLAIARLDLRAAWTRLALIVGGASVAGAGVLLGLSLGAVPPWPSASFGWPPAWASLTPHSNAALEMVVTAAAAVAAVGACLWLSDLGGRWLQPLRDLGAMAFTAYVAHVLIIAFAGNDIVYEPSNVTLVSLLASFTLLAWAYRRWRPQGPLEELMSRASRAAADAAVARGRSRAPTT